MSESLRIALLLDPLSVTLEGPLQVRVKWDNHAPQLASELLGRGHNVRGFGAPPGTIPRSSELPEESEEKSGWVSKLRAFEPNVLLAYDALSPAAFRGARMARKLGAALVLVESALPAGGRWFDRARQGVGELLWGPYVRRTAGGVVALDPVSEDQARREGFLAELIHRIPFGVDTSAFRPGLMSRLVPVHRIRGRMLLYVGPFEARRGLETLIAAFARTVGQRSDWNLVLAGQGSLAASLDAQARRLGVADRVHWLTRPRPEELPGLMSASTLLAVPALDDRVLGRQVGRALACGLPVLASDLPRLSALVEPGETGLLVPPGDTDAWSEAIRQACSSPVARARWATNGRRVAEERLAWSQVASEFEDVFLLARERVQRKLARPRGLRGAHPERA